MLTHQKFEKKQKYKSHSYQNLFHHSFNFLSLKCNDIIVDYVCTKMMIIYSQQCSATYLRGIPIRLSKNQVSDFYCSLPNKIQQKSFIPVVSYQVVSYLIVKREIDSYNYHLFGRSYILSSRSRKCIHFFMNFFDCKFILLWFYSDSN